MSDYYILGGLAKEPSLLDEHKIYRVMFRHEKDALIYDTIKRLYEDGRKIDLLILSEEVGQKVGISYLEQAIDHNTTANFKYYVDRFKDDYLLRQIRAISLDLQGRIEKPPEETIEWLDGALTALSEESVESLSESKDLIPEWIDDLERIYTKKEMSGIPAGYENLDIITDGWQKGDMIILAARPSIGKTALALNFAVNAMKKGHAVGFFSCEMSRNLIGRRLVSAESKINLMKLRAGKTKPATFSDIMAGFQRMSDRRLLIDDTQNIPLGRLKAQSRNMKRKGVQIIFVDYMTLIRHPDRRMPRYQQVSEISQELKGLARELKIPIMVLSQVGRQADGKPPTLADIRASGDIEQDADIVLFIHRDDVHTMDTQLIIAKHRNGPTDIIPMIYRGDIYTFFEKHKE